MQGYHGMYTYQRPTGERAFANSTFATNGLRTKRAAEKSAAAHFWQAVAAGTAVAGSMVLEVRRLDDDNGH